MGFIPTGGRLRNNVEFTRFGAWRLKRCAGWGLTVARGHVRLLVVRKIPTVFERDWNGDRSRVVDKVHAGCEWVLAGEGVATQKYDGMCCYFDGTTWFKRREIKAGQPTPPDFTVADHDEETGKTVGWVPIGRGPDDRYLREAADWADKKPAVGTYEFLGPKSQGNVERRDIHFFLAHAEAKTFADVPRTFEGLRSWLAGRDIEGLVFHHPDGRMAKIKLRDFGLKRSA